LILELSDLAQIDLTRPPYLTEGLSVVVLGNKGAGKSNIMAVLAEEAHRAQIPFIYYDPNGDACSLRELGPDIAVIGDPGHNDQIRRADYSLSVALRDPGAFIEMVLKDGFSLIVDLSEGEEDESEELRHLTFQALLKKHYQKAGKLRVPCMIFVDEAHVFAPQSNANKMERCSLAELGKVASDGRKRGMMLVVASQRATYLNKKVIYGANVRIFGKVTWWPDYDGVVRHYLPVSFQQVRGLHSGQVFIVGEHIVNDYPLSKIQIRRRSTTDLGSTPIIAPKRLARPSLHQLQLTFEVK
jgi:DNA helicase HerA-like ATPase